MKTIKKIILLFLMLNIAVLFACHNTTTKNVAIENNNSPKNIKIVTTIFPIYDIVRQVLPNNNYDITLLLDNGIDIHNFSPTANDILNVANCDLFIYIGGESDSWVDRLITTSQNNNLKTLNLINALKSYVKEEEIVEGMQHEEHEEHEDVEKDEHIWLSLRNADKIVDAITNAIIEIDVNQKDKIIEKSNNYKQKINSLDEKYSNILLNKKYNTILFGDRFPFRYFVDDYNIDYYAAFSGCSAEAEASFETVAFLANKIDELNLQHVCAVNGSSHKIATSIINSTKNKNQDIIYFNSMENIFETNDLNNNYLKFMEDNLIALSKALN